jgi:hypothetical protein
VDQTLRDAIQERQTSNYTFSQDIANQSNFDHLSLNVSATALRRIAHLSVVETRAKISDPEILKLRKQLLASLLETVGSQMVIARDSPGRLFNTYALADIFYALAIIQHGRSTEFMQPLAILVLQMMQRHDKHEIHKLGPIRLLQCLQAMTKLQIEERKFRTLIHQRLLKPDAVSKVPARSLSYGLSALAGSEMEDRNSKLLTRAFMRRLRKQKVRETATVEDLCRALVAADQIFKKDGMEEFRHEAAVFGFTSLRVIIQKTHSEESILTPRQVSDLIYSWSRLSDNQKEDFVIEELLQICQEEGIIYQCNLQQLEKIIGSVERLQMKNHSETMRLGGNRLLQLVVNQQAANATQPLLSPKTINDILRCPILLHRKNKAVMKPYLEAASLLFHDQNFVSTCSLSEIANFLWFKSIAKWYDGKVLKMLCQRILDQDIVDSCSPKLASRILGTFTSTISLRHPGDSHSVDLLNVTSRLFHSYGVHLLSSKLQPAEASSALYAYAKASYLQDMGIYDHLVSQISVMASECTARQLSQSLWCCGKMIVFERIELGDDKLEGPPYLETSMVIAQELCLRSSELTCADVTQCIWALARLRVTDRQLFHPFINRAKELVPYMNMIEATNVLWGLGKARFMDENLTLTLSEKLSNGSTNVSPKQAASALYALGRLKVRDKELFDNLSLIIVDQIDETSAHAIANVLWAYRTVHLKPPEELLTLWASEKLGLIGIEIQKPPGAE